MKFICLDRKLCVTTQFNFESEIETMTVGKNGARSVATGESTTGEMLLFRQGELPDLFERGGKPKTVEMEFTDNELLYSMSVLFSTFEQLPDVYQKCDAAYVEFVAESMQTERITEDINRVSTFT